MSIRNIELLFPGEDWPFATEPVTPDPEPEPDPDPEFIFTSQLPASPNQTDGTYTLGTVFTSNVDGQVVGIRAYVGGVPSTSPLGLLYRFNSNTDGTLLASRAFGTLTPNAWNSILFTTPVDILAGDYFVAAWGPTNNYSATANFFASSGVTNGHLTAPQATGPRLNGKFKTGASAVYPDQAFNDGCYFVDPLFLPAS